MQYLVEGSMWSKGLADRYHLHPSKQSRCLRPPFRAWDQTAGRRKDTGGRLTSWRPYLRVHPQSGFKWRSRPHRPWHAGMGPPRMESDASAKGRGSRREERKVVQTF